MRVSALAIYPVKGGAAVGLEAGDIDALGLSGDRRYCLARPGGRVFTQRDDAALARLQASLDGERLTLDFDGDTLQVGPEQFAAATEIRVWSSSAAARLATHAVNAALTRWFATPLLLARLEQPVRRGDAALAFGDGAALLVTNAASLDALNAALDAPVPMDRFRPNIVVSGADAFAEDGWSRLRIGDALLMRVDACGRCEVTTIDQASGAALGDEPLRTLSRLRMQEGEPVFGVRYSVQQPDRVRIGDVVEALD
jgi:uncharacterized protein YcbX